MRLAPHKASPIGKSTREAWWYEDKRSIAVYLYDGEKVLSCKINAKAIEKWLERTKR
jgi:hypothetical protein